MGCQPLDVEQLAAAGPQGLDQGHQGHLGRVPLVVEHRLAGEKPSYGHPVQASCDAGRRPRLTRPRHCAPSRARAGARRRFSCAGRSMPPVVTGRRTPRRPARTRCRSGSRSAGRTYAATGSRLSPSRGMTPRGSGDHQASLSGLRASGTGRSGRRPAACPGSRSAPIPTTSPSRRRPPGRLALQGNAHSVAGGWTGAPRVQFAVCQPVGARGGVRRGRLGTVSTQKPSEMVPSGGAEPAYVPTPTSGPPAHRAAGWPAPLRSRRR